MNVSQVVVPFSFLFAFRAAGTIYSFRPYNWRQIAIALADPGIRSSLGGWSATRNNGSSPGKRIIKGRPFGVGFDRSHLNLQQGAPS